MKGTYSVEQAAQIIGCGRRQAYAAVHAGEIPSIRIGSRFYVPRAALHALLGLTTNADEAGARSPAVATTALRAAGSPARRLASADRLEISHDHFTPQPAA